MTSVESFEHHITRKTNIKSESIKFPQRYTPEHTQMIGIYYLENGDPALVTISTGKYTLTTGDTLSDIIVPIFTPIDDIIRITGNGIDFNMSRQSLLDKVDTCNLLLLKNDVFEQVLLYKTQLTLLLEIIPLASLDILPDILSFNGLYGSILFPPGMDLLHELYVKLHTKAQDGISEHRDFICHSITRDLVSTIDTGSHKNILSMSLTVLRRYLFELCTLSEILKYENRN